MNGPIMADPAENFNRLAEHIDDLEPGQIETELATMLDDGIQRDQNPLLRILVSRGEEGEDVEASPALNVLGSVEEAIGRTPSEKARSTLGGMAVDVVSRALTHQDFRPGSYTYVTQLTERAERLTALQTDPEEKAYSLIGLARNLGEADLSETDMEESVFWRTSSYLDQACAEIKAIDNPLKRFHAYQRLGEQAADSLHEARFDLDGGDEALAERLTGQPISFFTEASQAAESIKNPQERARLRAELVHSIAVGTPRIQRTELDPALFDELTSYALQETDAQLRDYHEGDLADLAPIDKVRGLSGLGDKLAKSVVMAYEQPSEQRKQLIAKTVEVFGAARDIAQKTPLPRRRRLFRGDWMEKTGHAVKAAKRFAKLDFNATKELLEIGFEMAAIRDAGTVRANGEDSFWYTGRVAATASEIALESEDAAKAVEVYSLIHRLESDRVGEGNESMIMKHNADGMRSIGTRLSWSGGKLELDEASTQFVEYMIQSADDTIGCLEGLSALRHMLDGYPELQQAIQDHLERVERENAERSAPQSETARLAREAVDSL